MNTRSLQMIFANFLYGAIPGGILVGIITICGGNPSVTFVQFVGFYVILAVIGTILERFDQVEAKLNKILEAKT